MSAVGNIIRSLVRQEGEPLNILTASTHEAYESNLSMTGHNFWNIHADGLKTWNSNYRPLPSNIHLLPHSTGISTIPEVTFDLVLSQQKFGQIQRLAPLAHALHVPLISLEHTLPVPSWPPEQLAALKRMRGHVNLFISEYSREKWGWAEDEADVIHHGIDTEEFCAGSEVRHNCLLSVVNDFVNRDWCCGYNVWRQTTEGLPCKIVGDTPGLSKPAKSVQELISFYQTSSVFLNTSLISPVPTALMEAMACGCAPVSTATCMITNIIENGKNGYISNSIPELRFYCQHLLDNPEKAREMGEKARQTILERFSLERFVKNWQTIFSKAVKIPYKGELI